MGASPLSVVMEGHTPCLDEMTGETNLEIIRVEKAGLYCAAGNFYIDPWGDVETALITHAHSDHSRIGNKNYLCSEKSVPIIKHRLGSDISIQGYPYGKKFQLGEALVSFHPAGHILGSAQVRVEVGGEVWVASGDYKRTFDPSCDPFEVVPCDVFISEATFALPIYHWESGKQTARKVYNWWSSDPTRPSLVFCYALGKAQRLLAELMHFTDKPVYLHGSMEKLTQIYRDQGIAMTPTKLVSEVEKDFDFKGQLILAPPSAHRSAWMKRFKEPQTAFASGWMQVRGARRRRGYEKGFILSDHADWNELNQTIQETQAKSVYLTHGKTETWEKFLKDKGLEVRHFVTQYEEDEVG